MKLTVTRLRTCSIVRPSGQLGTMGWSPKPWTCAATEGRQSPIEIFLRYNRQWARSDIEGVTYE
jgi:hypothetical protein